MPIRRLPFLTIALVLCGFSALAACSGGASSEPTESNESNQIIHPDGSDVPGKLLVTAPPGASSVDKSTFSVGRTATDLGSAFGPLAVGMTTFDVTVRGNFAQGDLFRFVGSSTVDILSGQTTTVTTGLLGAQATTGPRTLGLRDLVLGWGIPIFGSKGSNDRGQLNETSDGSKLAPLLPGDYEIQFGLDAIDGVPLVVESGKTTMVTLTDTVNRRITRLRAPARERPDATCSATPQPRWTIGLKGTPSTIANVDAKDGDELDIGVSPRNEGATYTWQAPMWTNSVEIPNGQRGAGPKPWAPGRLDITDVSVSGHTVKGTYAIYQANAAGAATGSNLLRCNAPTNTGVDVPPGHYRVEISYDTVEAGTKKDVHIFDVP